MSAEKDKSNLKEGYQPIRKKGYQPQESDINKKNPPRGGSGVPTKLIVRDRQSDKE